MLPAQRLAPVMLVLSLLVAGESVAADQDKDKGGTTYQCPKMSKHRTAAEVFADRMAALAAGEFDLSFCNYAEDAVVIMPGSVIRGREQIKAGFRAFGALFGGLVPPPTTVTVEGDVVLVTFSLYTAGASIPDGADTLVIRDGLIQTQTVHATIVFPTP